MDTAPVNTSSQGATAATSPFADIIARLKSATPLTPLQLNAIRLDVRHTILTPELLNSKPQALEV